jgi:hypothetical protein
MADKKKWIDQILRAFKTSPCSIIQDLLFSNIFSVESSIQKLQEPSFNLGETRKSGRTRNYNWKPVPLLMKIVLGP